MIKPPNRDKGKNINNVYEYLNKVYLDRLYGKETKVKDNIHNPEHYTQHPSGIECIQIVEHMGFNLGNAIKYVWRADLKGNAVEDLKKAVWYINRELERRTLNIEHFN